MTVYFITKVDDQSTVKIGTSDDVESRLLTISGQYGAIELLAQCDGGYEVELAFHRLFSDDWSEGEWFNRSPMLDAVIAKYASGVTGKRFFGRLRVVAEMEGSPIEKDKAIARSLLKRVMDSFGAEQTGRLLMSAHRVISQINPMWSRRRVRAIWNAEVQRIDYFEIRDLEAAVAAIEARRRVA